jgi:epoxyqueuosine reductase QueG
MGEKMTLTEDLKKKAVEVGFATVGVSSPDLLHGLPHGKVWNIYPLRSPEEELAHVKSVILMGYHVWDKAFNIQVDSARLSDQGFNKNMVENRVESYQLYYEVMKNKAWVIVDYLARRGFESKPSLSIPLKTSAVRCGLGCQGKNTLLITPNYGPMVRLISVLTSAELELDEPFKEDLCRDCQKCVAACPTKALEPYKLKINRCMTYSAENSSATDVDSDVTELERKLVQTPTPCSYIECTICVDACPIGKSQV